MRRRKNKLQTFTKKWVNRYMWFTMVCIAASYVLAFMEKYAIAETLSQTVVTGQAAIMIPYFCKSLFETRWEKEQNFKERRYEDSLTIDEITRDDEAVG